VTKAEETSGRQIGQTFENFTSLCRKLTLWSLHNFAKEKNFFFDAGLSIVLGCASFVVVKLGNSFLTVVSSGEPSKKRPKNFLGDILETLESEGKADTASA